MLWSEFCDGNGSGRSWSRSRCVRSFSSRSQSRNCSRPHGARLPAAFANTKKNVNRTFALSETIATRTSTDSYHYNSIDHIQVRQKSRFWKRVRAKRIAKTTQRMKTPTGTRTATTTGTTGMMTTAVVKMMMIGTM